MDIDELFSQVSDPNNSVKGRWDSSEDEEDQDTAAIKKLSNRDSIPDFSTSELNNESSKKLSEFFETVDSEQVNGELSNQKRARMQEASSEPCIANISATDSSTNSGGIVKQAHNPMFHGCRSVDNYQRIKFIDQGTYGMVFKARSKDSGEVVALKQVKLGKESNRVGFPITALRETNILLSLNHPNIVKVREMVVGSSTDKVYMVMDYMENDLKGCIEQMKYPFTISEVSEYYINIVFGVLVTKYICVRFSKI